MHRIMVLLGLVGCSMAVWAGVPLDRSVQWYPQAGMTPYPSIEHAMKAKRHELHLLAPPSKLYGSAQKAWPKVRVRTVNNCADYQHYVDRRYAPATAVDFRVSAEYKRICSTLAYVQHAEVAHHNFILPKGQPTAFWPDLPAGMLLPALLNQDSTQTIRERCPDTIVLHREPAESAPAGVPSRRMVTLYSKACASYVNIQWLAQGDINHSGTQDVLLEVYQWGHDGNFRGQHVLAVSRHTADAPVHVLEWKL